VVANNFAKRVQNPSFPEGAVIYRWLRGFLLLAPTFIVDRGEHPTRRPSIRVMLSLRAPFDIEFPNGSWLKTSAVMMSAEAQRRQIIAKDAGFALLDLAISTPEYATLASLMTGRSVLPLERGAFEALKPQLELAGAGTIAPEQVRTLRREVVHAIAGVYPEEAHYDPRVETALRVIQQRRLEDVTLKTIAEAVYLSPDRLRHLFREQVGCTVSNYARTAAVWKALSARSVGKQLTELAHEAGFYDYSHFNHVFQEMFGFCPGMTQTTANVRVIACT